MPTINNETPFDKDNEVRLELSGEGPSPCPVMLVFQSPLTDDIKMMSRFSDSDWDVFFAMCDEAGLSISRCYCTYAIRSLPKDVKKPKQSELKEYWPMLQAEIEAVKPRLVVLFGPYSIKLFISKSSTLAQFSGGVTSSDKFPGVDFMPLYQPSYVLRYPESRPQYVASLELIARYLDGASKESDNTTQYEVVASVPRLIEIVQGLTAKPTILSLDCEWHGNTYASKGAYIRTVQFKTFGEPAYILPFRGHVSEEREDGTLDAPHVFDEFLSEPAAWKTLKYLLEHPNTNVVGHNVRSDGEWLLHAPVSIDIRSNTIYDTMLAEHCINSMGPFGLEVLSCKYTTLGRYDMDMEHWKLRNPGGIKGGFGRIPDAVLFPYAAGDVECVLQIMEAQQEKLKPYLVPRGEYPSVFDIAMNTARLLYELEETGMLVDPARLGELTTKYQSARAKMLSEVQSLCLVHGMQNFNPESYPQKVEMLFTKLALAPVKTTGKPSKQWSWVIQQSPEVQGRYSPAVDQDTMEILADKDPVVRKLLDYSRVSVICKNFLRDDETGGIPGNIWPDGRIHARFSQLAETGRFRHSKPNVANFPKAAEGGLGRIVGKDTPGVRTIIVADPGWVFIEGDFKQAELFVLACLANDQVYLDCLTTPGKDLHDLTTISSFKFQVLLPSGEPANMDEIVELASLDPKLHKEIESSLIYVKPNGERLTRKEFKEGARVAGKAVNFGVNYGRGAKAIQIQVMADTGLILPVDVFQDAIDAWHSTYQSASKFLKYYGDFGADNGYVENTFGRRRLWAAPQEGSSDSGKGADSIRREAGNFMIQSTVADALMLAMWKLDLMRRGAGMQFRIINPIHDALMLMAPENEVDSVKAMLSEAMSSIMIPTYDGRPPFHLDVDLAVFSRWGAKE